jgi:hypothetical protein
MGKDDRPPPWEHLSILSVPVAIIGAAYTVLPFVSGCGRVLTADSMILDASIVASADSSSKGGCLGGCPVGLSCVGAECACSTTSCPGCCAPGACLSGTTIQACGAAGQACATCNGATCSGGRCTSSATKPILLLFGGYTIPDTLDDTWSFDGTSWTELTPNAFPPGRGFATMATLDDRVVLFGGQVSAAGPILNDTWAFDGSMWTQIQTKTSPPVRTQAAMAAVGGHLVLFGGLDSSQHALGDTWMFDGSDWTRLTTTTFPPLSYASVAPLGDTVILFGGLSHVGIDTTFVSETWTLRGADWSDLSIETQPSPRVFESMATIPGDAAILLFSGNENVDADELLNDTWTFDGEAWSALSVANSPAPRQWAPLAPFQSGLVLFGGASGLTLLGDTWTFSDSTWQSVPVPLAPGPRAASAMAQLP